MKTLKISLTLSAVLLFGGIVFAQNTPTITFNVPLQLTDLHQDVESIKVQATVFDNAGANHACASGSVEIPCPSTGTVNQTVSVVATQVTGQDITKAMNYGVSFLLKANGTWATPQQSSAAPVQVRAKDGTPFAQLNRGDVHF